MRRRETEKLAPRMAVQITRQLGKRGNTGGGETATPTEGIHPPRKEGTIREMVGMKEVGERAPVMAESRGEPPKEKKNMLKRTSPTMEKKGQQ